MSQENVELVRRVFDAWNAQDQGAWLDAFDPEVEVRPAISGGMSAVGMELLRGLPGLHEWWNGVREVHEDFFIRADSIRELAERVLVIGATVGRGSVSGVDVEAPHAWVLWLRERRIVRLDSYTDPAEALEAVGLSG